ncbi:GolD/DthD family dehydrogenase [Deinococcus sp.]|uniref:GolD/DthD family dehydrogenase n=1 Tax=Deinococcus sp. TaxID=47478 RepID=UPI00286D804B|nr:D-threitol dehydrogenase [Deinococcus sp.]
MTQPEQTVSEGALHGRVALITGGASGIGLAVAQHFVRAGAAVVLLDRAATVTEVASAFGARHSGVVLDVTSIPDVQTAVAAAAERYGRIDILVNNAGVALLSSALDVTPEEWDASLDVNLRSAFFMAQTVGRFMVTQGYGRIVNVASQASVVALERHAAYCASKAGLVGLTRVLALEWAQYGVTVNAISPTVVETELGKRAWAGEIGEAMKLNIPVGRFGRPEEIASAIAFLCGEDAGLITGENLMIDGGYTIR